MSDAVRYATRAVLAASKRGALPLLTHTIETTWLGTEIRVLCSRVKLENLADKYADDEAAQPTCPTCRRRDPRFKDAQQ